MKTINVAAVTGSFAEDKDAARELRTKQLVPALKKGERVSVDFRGVDLATQSFVHALISDAIRSLGPDVLDRVTFAHCKGEIRSLISIVAEYSQEVIE